MNTATVDRFDKLTVDDLKRSTSILDVLAKYGITTEKAGRQYKACCPFHEYVSGEHMSGDGRGGQILTRRAAARIVV